MKRITIIITLTALILNLYASNVLSAPFGPPDYDYYAPPGPSRFGQQTYGNRDAIRYEDESLSRMQQKYLHYENIVIKYLKPVLTGLLGPLIPTVVINFNQKH